jgi:TonB-linked SusC/RagA family outer membrane protein
VHHPLRNAFLTAATCTMILPAGVFGQAGSINVKVLNKETGEPVSGAQVFVEGTNLGNVSNAQGQVLFLNVSPGRHTITARFIGYADATDRNVVVQAGQATNLELKLAASVLTLDAVRVSASTDPVAGVKSPFSIGRVSTENLQKTPAANDPITSLQGKIAGLTIVRSTGQPGKAADDVSEAVVLRTPTAITGSVRPLYVVDGVILAQDVDGTTMDLESSDIESIEVIKGAAAASLYGSRAASGVISITTNRGRSLNLDQTRIRVRTEMGLTSLAKWQYYPQAHHYRMTSDLSSFADTMGNAVTWAQRVVKPDRVLDNPWLPGERYDNVAALLQDGLFTVQTADLSYYGATTNFLVSASRRLERGTLVGSDGYEQGTFRFNLDHRLRDDFAFSLSGQHTRSATSEVINRGGTFYNILSYPPHVDLTKKDANGKYLQIPDSSVRVNNPLWLQDSQDDDDSRSRTLLSGDLRYTPLKWLTLQGNLSYDRSDNFQELYIQKGQLTSATSDDGSPSDGRLRYNSDIGDAINGTASLTANRNFGDLTTRATFRALMQREKSLGFEADGRDFWVGGIRNLDVTADQSIESSLTETRSNGYSVSIGADYAGKYIIDALGRRDGSSRFGPNERWQNYGRVALAYRMAMEPWWPIAAITEFKPRFAIGTAGSVPGFSNQYQTWSVDGNTGAVSKGTLGNPDLKPAFTVEREMGVDMMIRDKYQLELTYAKQKTTDNIISMTTAGLTGYLNQFRNEGTIEGSTYEATLEAVLVNKRNFSWNTTVVWDRSRSIVTEWNRACLGASNTLGEICAGRTRGEMQGYKFMHSLNELPAYMQPYADQFNLNDDGYVVWVGSGNTYKDGFDKNLWGTSTSFFSGYPVPIRWGHPLLLQNNRGALDSKVDIGDSNADFQVGWLNNITWRGISLHTQFHAQVGGETYNNTRRALYTDSRHSDLVQTGKERGLQKPIDYYSTGIASGTWFVNEAFVEDASYLKMRALSLSYRISRSVLEKIGLDRFVSGMDLGINGRNIFTLTHYRGFDPEVGGAFFRVDQWYYPPGRTFTFTGEVTF